MMQNMDIPTMTTPNNPSAPLSHQLTGATLPQKTIKEKYKDAESEAKLREGQ